MSVEDTALYLGLSTVSVYKLVKKKQMPHLKVGNLLKFTVDDIDAWIRSKTYRPRA